MKQEFAMKDTFVINGERKTVEFDAADTLLTVLRRAGHTEVHSGCDRGECGVCTVLLSGKPVNSCQVFAASVRGRAVTTVKGIGTLENPHPLQKAFAEHGGIQCGFCTPGKIVASYALLEKTPNPGDEEIKRALDGNLCRCTGYSQIIESVRSAAETMHSGEPEEGGGV